MARARSIVLSGPMGVGKSTVAHLLAVRTGAPHVDVDAALEAEVGKPVARIFADEGEVAFRAREAASIARLLESDVPHVIALGGGAVMHEPTRRALLHRAIVVTLRAPAKTLVQRIGAAGIAARPLLSTEPDPEARLASLVASRDVAYAEAHAHVDTEGRAPEEVAEHVARIWERDPVAVALGRRSYRVEIGNGVLATLPAVLDALAAPSVLVVSDERIWPFVSQSIEPLLAGRRTARVLLAPGETNKTIASVERIWDAAPLADLDRSGVVLAVGGGVVGDLAGFAAATWLRGVRFVQVPTTLLAMVDASVGGKTAIDRAQGKNLVGAFHQPSAVIADLDLLATLPSRELRSGLAEVVKTALIGDARLFASLEEGDPASDPRRMTAVVRASIAHKARVVAEDEREITGARAALNFGHTIGHALEAHGGYAALTHGEAVSLGMIAALRVGIALGRTPAALLERARALLGRLGLPVELDDATLRAALPFVARDKKRAGAHVSYVIVPEVGRAELIKLGLDELARALLPQG
jgi:shikimate kinase/3-dehydroquinate synthase